MSQRQFPNRKKEERLIQHSQKSAVSANQSYTSRKEAAKLTTKRHNLVIERDWEKKQSDEHWKNAKEYEAQGRIQMALESKTMCEHHAQKVKRYNKEIKEIDDMIQKLSLVYSVRLNKGQNYASIKLKEPPSDNQE